jgi:hypothetical protein
LRKDSDVAKSHNPKSSKNFIFSKLAAIQPKSSAKWLHLQYESATTVLRSADKLDSNRTDVTTTVKG